MKRKYGQSSLGAEASANEMTIADPDDFTSEQIAATWAKVNAVGVPYVSSAWTPTAYDLIARVVREVTFVNAPIRTQIDVDHAGFYVLIDIFERDTGDPNTIQLRDDLPTVLDSYEHALDWVYERVHDAWTHELNEALHVNGKRRRDLHDKCGSTIPPPPSKFDVSVGHAR